MLPFWLYHVLIKKSNKPFTSVINIFISLLLSILLTSSAELLHAQCPDCVPTTWEQKKIPIESKGDTWDTYNEKYGDGKAVYIVYLEKKGLADDRVQPSFYFFSRPEMRDPKHDELRVQLVNSKGEPVKVRRISNKDASPVDTTNYWVQDPGHLGQKVRELWKYVPVVVDTMDNKNMFKAGFYRLRWCGVKKGSKPADKNREVHYFSDTFVLLLIKE